jgi:hypothetical protein
MEEPSNQAYDDAAAAGGEAVGGGEEAAEPQLDIEL